MTDQRQWSRRRWLAAAGSTAAVGLAGCSSDDGTGGTDDDGSTPGGNSGNGDTSNPDGDTSEQSFEGPVTADGEWTVKHRDTASTRATSAVSGPPVPVERRWAAENGETFTSPVVVDGTVYGSTRAGSVYAFDLLSGETQWEESLGRASIHSLAADGDRVYVGRDGAVTALATDGTTEWEFTDIDLGLNTNVADGSVYVTDDGVLYARDAETGDERWTTEFEGAIRHPTVADGAVVGKSTEKFHVFDAATGEERVRVEHTGSIAVTDVAVSDGTAYYSADTGIEARSIDDGSLEWHWTDGIAEETVPAVADGVVYARPNVKTGPYRIDAEAGENLGAIDIEAYSGPPAVADGTVYFGMRPDSQSRGSITAVDADSLEQLWTAKVRPQAPTQSAPRVLEDIIVFGTDRGVYAFAPST